MNMMICFAAMIIDRIIGDPSKLPHPVILIGHLINKLEKMFNNGRYRILKGAFASFVVIALVFIVVNGTVYLMYSIHWTVGLFYEIICIAIALAQKSLAMAALDVSKALENDDMVQAREKLSWIVGRDTAHLNESEIVRGVVETVSENTSDGVTAPLFYALLFGATGVWVYKAINTLDSMIAYKNDRYKSFGFVAAKIDDIANFIPSRITGFFILLFTKCESKLTLKTRIKNWLYDAKKHPSPNSGYLEAATAYQLGIRLGGFNSYHGVESFRAYMGEPIYNLQRTHITKSIQHMYHVTFYFLFIVGGLIYVLSLTWG